MLHPMTARPQGQQELKGMEHMVLHSTQETTAALSCPNSCQTFKLYQLHSECFVCWFGVLWLVGCWFRFPFVEEYQKFIQHYDNEPSVRKLNHISKGMQREVALKSVEYLIYLILP